MEQTPEAALYDARKWSMRRIKRARPVADKNAIYKEFEEWIEVEPSDQDLEVLFLENLSESVSYTHLTLPTNSLV